MPFDLNVLRQRLSALFNGFTSGQKVMTGLAAVAVLVGGFTFMRWAGRPSYEPAFSNLDPASASDVTSRLSSQGVPYRLADGGGTVMVPKDQVNQVRIDLASDGLPGDKTGYALLDNQGITTSEFAQRTNFQRAVEGELKSTIESIDGVGGANVHLVIPQDDLFAEDESRPTASVLIQPSSEGGVSARHVQAIVNLVSTSVEGLKPEDVTVADSSGRLLSAPGLKGSAATDINTEQTLAFEQNLADDITRMLSRVVGPEGAVVTVAADLDFDTRTTTREKVSAADPPATVSERTVNEQFEGNNSGQGGLLGPTGVPTANTDETQYEREETEAQNAVNTRTDTIEAAPGEVERLSVAVVLDEEKAAAVEPAEIEDVVAAAINFDPGRGDNIDVSEMPFDTAASEEAQEALEKAEADRRRDEMLDMLRTGGALLIVFVVLFLAYRSAKKSSRERRLPLSLESLALPPGSGGSDGGIYVEPDVTEELELPGVRQQQALARMEVPELTVGAEVADLIDRQPEEVASLLRGWLADRRGR